MRQPSVTLNSSQFVTDHVAWKSLPSARILQLAQILYHNTTRWHNLMWRLAEFYSHFHEYQAFWWNVFHDEMALRLWHAIYFVCRKMYCLPCTSHKLSIRWPLYKYNADVWDNIPMQGFTKYSRIKFNSSLLYQTNDLADYNYFTCNMLESAYRISLCRILPGIK